MTPSSEKFDVVPLACSTIARDCSSLSLEVESRLFLVVRVEVVKVVRWFCLNQLIDLFLGQSFGLGDCSKVYLFLRD